MHANLHAKEVTEQNKHVTHIYDFVPHMDLFVGSTIKYSHCTSGSNFITLKWLLRHRSLVCRHKRYICCPAGPGVYTFTLCITLHIFVKKKKKIED